MSRCILIALECLVQYPDKEGVGKDIIDTNGYKVYPGSIDVLKVLRDKQFRVIVTSDSSSDAKVSRIALTLGICPYVERILCFRELGVKKRSEGYLQAVVKFVGGEVLETWVVACRVDKEIVQAYRDGQPHVWILSNLKHIVTYI